MLSDKKLTVKHGKDILGGLLFIFLAAIVKEVIIALIDIIPIYVASEWSKEEIARGKQAVEDWWLALVTLIICAVLTIVVFLIGQLVVSRWRKTIVFISYQHDFELVAARLARTLSSKWAVWYYLPYLPMEHDHTIQVVRRYLRLCDVMITMPGVEKSFVDAEILAASVLGKPIVLLRREDGRVLPDTAFRGYPVFDLNRLEDREFAPLERFVSYISNHWTDAFRNVWRAVMPVFRFWVIFNIVFGCIGTFLLIVFGALLSYYNSLAYFEFRLVLPLIGVGVPTAGVLIVFPLSIIKKYKAIRIARQAIVTGSFERDELAKGLSEFPKDLAILDCLCDSQKPRSARSSV